jgi:murein DD-endopeptidase MepM/ murein hydrolase activator NlpD
MRALLLAGSGFVAGMLSMYLLLESGTLRVPGIVAEPAASVVSAAAPKPPVAAEVQAFRERKLLFPVQGGDPSRIVDTFDDDRGNSHRHEAIDIIAPRGTPVVAVEDGSIKKLFDSKAGGLTIYQFDADEIYCYYYAHLDRYAFGMREGMTVRRGDIIGYVGSTGNASPDNPHLHFAIFRLGPEKRWWEGTPINPYPLLRKDSR